MKTEIAPMRGYRVIVMHKGGILHIETGMPGDFSGADAKSQTHDIAMLPSQCRELGEDLLKCAEHLETEASRKPQ